MNSAGSATTENAKVLDSVTGKLQNLRSQWEQFSTNIISSNLLKFLLDLGTAFLKLANTGFGQLAVKTTIATTAITLFNVAIKKLKTTEALSSLTKWTTVIKGLGTEASTGAFKVDVLAKSLSSLGKVKLLALAKNPLTWVIAGGYLVTQLIKHLGELEKQAETNYNNANKRYEESISQLEKTGKEYESLKEKIKELESKGTNRTIIEEATLQKYKEQLKTLEEQLKKLDEQTKERKKQAELAAKERADELTRYSRRKTTYDVSGQEQPTFSPQTTLGLGEEKNRTLSYSDVKVINYKEDINRLKEINNLLNQGNLSSTKKGQLLKEQQEIMTQIIEQRQKELDASNLENLSDEERNKHLQKYNELLRLTDPETWMKGKFSDLFNNKKIMQATSGIQTFASTLIEMGNDGQLTAEEINKLKEQFPEFNQFLVENSISTEDASKYLLDYKDNIITTTEGIASANDVLTEYSTQMDKLKEQYDNLTSAVDEYNESGYITADTLQKLADDNLLQYLDLENGKLVANASSLFDLAEAHRATASQKLADAMMSEILAAAEDKANAATSNAAIGVSNLAVETANAATEAANATPEFIGFASAVDKANKALKGKELTETQTQDIENIKNKYKSLWAEISKMPTFGSKKITGTSKKKSSSSEKEWWETELSNLKEQYENNDITIEQYINSLDNLLGRVQEGTEAWKKINKELQKQKLQKVEDDYKRGTISFKEYIKQLQNLQKAYKEGTDGWLNLADKIKKGLQDLLKEQKSAYDDAHKAATKIIDEEIDKINDQRDATEEYYDKLIEEKKKANDETEKELELARLQEALEKAKTERTKKVFVEGLGWQWTTDKEAIESAQKDLDDFLNQKEIDELEDAKDKALAIFDEQLKAWEKYKESWSDVVDDYENQQARLILQQTLGADAEAKILQQRLDILEKFKNEYNQTLSQIDTLEKTSSTNTGALNSYYNNTRGFAGGIKNGVVDYSGYARVHGTTANPEYILNNGQMKNLLSTLTRPTKNKLAMSGGVVNNYNFGDIKLPNVTNAQQFLRELNSIVNITKHQ
nr:MAG TPA: minor tail protein [Caudoviricetes sp.]